MINEDLKEIIKETLKAISDMEGANCYYSEEIPENYCKDDKYFFKYKENNKICMGFRTKEEMKIMCNDYLYDYYYK